MDGKRYARVIVDIAHSNVDKIFDYILPNEMEVEPGCRVQVPFGSTTVEGFVLSLADTTDWAQEKLKVVKARIDDLPIVTTEQLQLAQYLVAEYHTTLAFALRLMFPAAMRGGRIQEKKIRIVTLLDEEAAKREKAGCYTRDGRIRAKNRLKTLELLEEGPQPARLLDSVSVRYLLEKKIALETFETSFRRPYEALEREEPLSFDLTDEQKKAISCVKEHLHAGEKKTVLLHGVTGSGKTQVYIASVKETLALGKTAIVLVPEISLAPQLLGEFTRYFGETIAVFHSGLSDGERYDEWRRVRLGQAKIVIGARSAVFMPLENLGLIVIDEEHAESYRAENHPPYHAAEVARIRSHLNGATLVLASATPRMESYMKAKLGIYDLIEMPKRVNGLPLPVMQVVDMKREFVRGNQSVISGLLYRELGEVLEKKEQALLFVNRRGYASSVICPSCGHVRLCSHCDVPLKYHKAQEALVCHYCGRSVPFTKTCPVCQEPYALLAGVGTEQVEEQLTKLFPTARLLRMDFDTTRKKDAHEQIYSAFKRHEADFLIGTQMIARGLDFEGVTLAAILSADASLTQGGYRAEENTFSMIEQVAGRAGRKKQGKVVIQTYNPDHYAITFATQHDYQGMYEQEICYRKATLKPPFTRLFRFVLSHREEERVKKVAEALENLLKEVLQPHLSAIIQFVAKRAPIGKLDGNIRYHILIKVHNTQGTRNLKKALLDAAYQVKTKGVTLGFEEDPYDIN